MEKATYDLLLGGPILITAPHSAALNRGGPEYGEAVRRHKR
jgi:hypothetical protein